MFEIDKQKFGAFVAELRKEKGMTQKELAQRLFISDKAVSKWEVGASIPDVTLLVPLAEQLGVTVTELLECRRMEPAVPMDAEKVEDLVKTAIAYQDEYPAKRGSGKKRPFLLALLLGVLEVVSIHRAGYGSEELYVIALLGGVFGFYFWYLALDRLPRYYDENKISHYGDVIFRMNAPMTFNNRNWPYIRGVGRIWSLFVLAVYPAVYFGFVRFFPELWQSWGNYLVLAMGLGGLVVPMLVAGKKYE